MTTLALSLGDPAGIGPEVAAKALAEWLAEAGEDRISIVGSRRLFDATCKRLGLDLSPERVQKARGGKALPALSFVNKEPEGFDPAALPAGPSAIGGAAAFAWLDAAIALAMRRQVAGVVTAPLSKRALRLAGHAFPGQTEILQAKSRAEHAVMMLVGGGLRVALATTHLRLADVPGTLTKPLLMRTIQVTAKDLRERFGIASPRIAACGLNPHAGESGDLGREDAEVIAPCVREFQALGVAVSGPFAADTLFPKAARGGYDAVVAMFHDQGMIPVKLASFGRGVNVTLGLPFVRTSPDHGTAWDIAGKGVAEHSSMREAIRLAFEMAGRPGAA